MDSVIISLFAVTLWACGTARHVFIRVRSPRTIPRPCRPYWHRVIDRATRKSSEHTMRAYRQDFTVMADLLTAGRPNDIALTDITKNMMRAAFVVYASVHEPASIWRCWSTWNVLCEFLYTAELIRPIRWLSWEGPRRPRRRPAPFPSPRSARSSTRFTQHGDSRENGAVSVQQIH
jgi:hypothetical protein